MPPLHRTVILRTSITNAKTLAASLLHTLSTFEQTTEVLEDAEVVQDMIIILDKLLGKLLKLNPEMDRIGEALGRCIAILRRVEGGLVGGGREGNNWEWSGDVCASSRSSDDSPTSRPYYHLTTPDMPTQTQNPKGKLPSPASSQNSFCGWFSAMCSPATFSLVHSFIRHCELEDVQDATSE